MAIEQAHPTADVLIPTPAQWNGAAWVTLGQRTAKRWTWAWDMLAMHPQPERDYAQLQRVLQAGPAEIRDDRAELEQDLAWLESFFELRHELIEERRQRFQAVVEECDQLIAEQEQGADGD